MGRGKVEKLKFKHYLNIIPFFKYIFPQFSSSGPLQYDCEEHRSTLLLQCVKPSVNEMYDELIPRQAQGCCSAQPLVDVLGDDVAVTINQGQKGNMGARSDGRGVHRKT